ncbi:MAG: hypothetical protein QW569_01660 [Candidatus Bathyarchaeia archaeon]|nr:hypothetical protein [Candidatus Bathyarchaeota archaeon]
MSLSALDAGSEADDVYGLGIITLFTVIFKSRSEESEKPLDPHLVYQAAIPYTL